MPSNPITVPSIPGPLLVEASAERQKKHANGTIYHFSLRHLMFFQDTKDGNGKRKMFFAAEFIAYGETGG